MKVTQLCPTLCDPMDYAVHGILQARIPEYWSGQPFPSPGDLPSPGIKPRSPTLQANSLPAESQGKPENTGEAREYCSGQPIPSPGDLPDPGIELGSALQADCLPTELSGKPDILNLQNTHATQMHMECSPKQTLYLVIK